jgi:hypothetical protein
MSVVSGVMAPENADICDPGAATQAQAIVRDISR